jgi:hypothetical protein
MIVYACANGHETRKTARHVLPRQLRTNIGAPDVDKKRLVCYYVIVMKLKQTLKAKYYTYQPGEFLPIFSGGVLLNKREFHIYRLTWIIRNHRAALYQFTHYAS